MSAQYDAVCKDLASTGIGLPSKLVRCKTKSLEIVTGRVPETTVTVPAVPEIQRRRGMPDARRVAREPTAM
jgi:hypothetical protein